jgi:hypothetical protein
MVNPPTSIALNLPLVASFFHFGGSQTLQNVLTLIYHSLMDVLTVCFANSNPWVCLQASYNVSLFSRRGSCLPLRLLMPLPVVLTFLRCSCRLKPRPFIPLLHCGCTRCFFPNVCPSGAPLAALSWPCFWQLVPYVVQEWHGRLSPTGRDQLLPGLSIALGPLLLQSAVPYG